MNIVVLRRASRISIHIVVLVLVVTVLVVQISVDDGIVHTNITMTYFAFDC